MPVGDRARLLAAYRALGDLVNASTLSVYVVPDLTDREREVLTAAAAGLEEQEIGEYLCISNRTARGHMFTISKKMGTRNRTQSAVLGLLSGVISEREVAQLMVRVYPHLTAD